MSTEEDTWLTTNPKKRGETPDYNWGMRIRPILGIALLLFACGFTYHQAQASPARIDESGILIDIPNPYDLIAAVNELRANNGLPPYEINPILMSIAQTHSEYQASIETTTHYGPDGSRPYQRALAAGYPVAGDLRAGGWFAENTAAGLNLSIENAIRFWQGDAPHLDTMLSSVRRDVGAGIAASGNYIYYTLDTGKSTGGPVPTDPALFATDGLLPAISEVTVIPSTPNPDGTIIHSVQRGETLWDIAMAYNITVEYLLEANGMSPGTFIYPGDTLIIRKPPTPTPTQPTPTNTSRPSPTSQPAAMNTGTATPGTPTPIPTRPLPMSTGVGFIVIIVVIAVGAAGTITWLSGRTPKQE